MPTQPGQRSPGSRIVALGHYLPTRVVTNHELATFVDTDDEWIRSRVGITARHFATSETIADMSAIAASKAMASAGITASAVDLVIVATTTAFGPKPVAETVAEELGIAPAASHDVYTACSGFSYALALADQAIGCGAARTALVIGAEKYSDVLDWSDRSTAVIFGDGAGAAVVQADERSGIGPVLWGSAPKLADAIIIRHGMPVAMRGQAVFRWATNEIPAIARAACERASVALEQLAAFIPHQANRRIVDHVASKLGLDSRTLVSRDISDSGNTGTASIPIALSKLIAANALRPGALALLLGFGGGLTYAGQVVRCP